MAGKDDLLVDEIFHSIQGEGPNTGKSSLFIRFSNCNLSCAHCDSKHSWTSKDSLHFSVGELVYEIVKLRSLQNFNNLVITGGEPFVQGNQVALLVQVIQSDPTFADMTIEVETNGSIINTIFPGARVHFNVSPKLSSFPQSKKKGSMKNYTSSKAYSYMSLQSYISDNTLLTRSH